MAYYLDVTESIVLKSLTVLFLGVLVCPSALAWEVDTHAWMAQRSFERSNLNANGPNGDLLLKRLGFDRYAPNAPFRSPGLTDTGMGPNSKYFDLNATWDDDVPPEPLIPSISVRFPSDWEHSRFPEGYRLGASGGALGPTPQLRLEAWFMRGVVREDDLEPREFT